MISLTSLNPPASFLTLLGLLFSISALSFLPFTGGPGLGLATGLPGLPGLPSTLSVAEPEVAVVGAGISTHSSPPMFISFRKNGQRLVRRLRDSWASADEIGTGEDFTIASTTSDVGRARRLRAAGVALDPVGEEKSLRNHNQQKH